MVNQRKDDLSLGQWSMLLKLRRDNTEIKPRFPFHVIDSLPTPRSPTDIFHFSNLEFLSHWLTHSIRPWPSWARPKRKKTKSFTSLRQVLLHQKKIDLTWRTKQKRKFLLATQIEFTILITSESVKSDNVLREKIYFLKDLIKTVKDISTEVAYLIFY